MFGAILVLQLKDNSDSETLTLVEKLMDTRLVSSVEFSPVTGKSFPAFRYPIILNRQERGVIVHPALLIDEVPSSEEELQEAGKKYGHSLVELWQKDLPISGDFAIEVLKATGWGIGRLEENEKGDLNFSLHDPVFGVDSELKERTVFLVGFIGGVLESALKRTLELSNYRFDGKSNALVVKFTKVPD
jgi:hypothetical protein